MIQQLEKFLNSKGYQLIPSNLPEFSIFYRIENSFVNVIHIIDYKKELYIGNDQYAHMQEKIRTLFREKGLQEIHTLSLILSEDLEKAKQMSMEDRFAWIIMPDHRRLIIFENQVSDFYGFHKEIEDWLLEDWKETPPLKKEKHKISVATLGIVILNIVVFILCTFMGNILYNIGNLDFSGIVLGKEYYRFFSCMFLHGSVSHLFNNMLLLFFVGGIIERKIGMIGFLVSYFMSGIGGGVLSLIYDVWTGVFIGSIGASGAIFGIVGVLLVLVIFHKGKMEEVTLPRLLFMIIYSLGVGFSSSTTDNAAHIGGFISGIVMGIIIYIIGKMLEKRKELQ